MTPNQYVSQHAGVSERQAQHTIQLLDEGATVPFIARYRKEATGQLDEVEIQAVKEYYQKYQEIVKRKETILQSIEEQGKLTPVLKAKIEASFVLQDLEDIYLPYKQKRKTRATMAIEKGLEPLAKEIFEGREASPERLAERFLNDQVANTTEALQGACDIMAEWMSENTDARNRLRTVFSKAAVISSKVKKNKDTEGAKYRDYFEFSEALNKIPPHRLLAIRRGEDEGFLSIDISPDEAVAHEQLDRIFVKGLPACRQLLQNTVADSYKRLLKPSIETEFSNSSKEKADKYSIQIFTENLRQLLLASPLGQKRTLAIDPGFRTGCKVVCLDENASLKADTVIYPFDKPTEAEGLLKTLATKHKIEAIAIGNGTAGRETEEFIQKILDSLTAAAQQTTITVYMVSEQGASIYSASGVAREEFPNKDVTVRGAISIGRRLMDPLAELVKIDPKSIGVGQYQHDVNQTLLKTALDSVVESCVNLVGVSLNTASKHLLSYVSGLGPSLAKNIVEYRTQNGDFKSRQELLKVPRLGQKAFEQCAGFLRIENAKNPLDNSAVHPERYDLIAQMAKDLATTIPELMKKTELRRQIVPKKYEGNGVGAITLQDILKELDKPTRDPRQALKAFSFDANVKKMDDLREGMVLPGIVTNITAFGAFVDIGVKQDGLVHLSQMANRYIKDPNEVVKLQQHVSVKVTEIDIARKRIALTMKL
jgi:protein Tex